MCNSGCHCRDCINTKLNDDGHRRAIEAIIGTNPGVFCLKFVPALVGLEHQQQRPEADEVPHLPASTATMSCTCQMSRCLKLYCQCFSSSTMCNSGCRCLDCMNTELNDGGRRRTIEAIIATNPGVFSPPPTAAPPPPTSATTATPSCTCHRGRCLKLYCQCFSSSVMCNSGCRCRDCMNTELNDDGRRRAIKAIIARNPVACCPMFVRDLDPLIDNSFLKRRLGIFHGPLNCRCVGCMNRSC